MKTAIELIQAEIKKLEDATPKEISWNDIGIIQGLEKAIELIESSEAANTVQYPVCDEEYLEDEDAGLWYAECPSCGATDGEDCDFRCPYNDSPFAYLVQNGYD